MKIRNATSKDKRGISELYYKLYPIEEKERKEKGLLVPIQKSKLKSILLVAEENKKVIGFIWGHFIVYGFFKYGTIDELFCEKEFRNKGVGKELIKIIIKKFKNLNAKIVLVGTEKENKEAINLYQKSGFKLGKESLWFYWNSKKNLPK